jgi:hypothetical protein
VEGTNKTHENGEAMGFVGVRLTVMLGPGAEWKVCDGSIACIFCVALQTLIHAPGLGLKNFIIATAHFSVTGISDHS